jgi:hypothetical protein
VPHSIAYLPALEGRALLDELNHRIKNELASVINLVSFKAVCTDNVDAKEELSNVVDLLHQHVEVHSILTMPDRDALDSANGFSRNNYTTYGYGRGYRHAYTAATAAYAYGRADASSDDGCYYVSADRRYGTRRVLVCHED